MRNPSRAQVVTDLLKACKYALHVLESIPEEYCEVIADDLDAAIDVAMLEAAITQAERFHESL
jgi:hypothetical protein